jgi:hypothetical protein
MSIKHAPCTRARDASQVLCRKAQLRQKSERESVDWQIPGAHLLLHTTLVNVDEGREGYGDTTSEML